MPAVVDRRPDRGGRRAAVDVKWVMSQVGHADSKMTLDVYAQLEQRIKPDHGRRFDELVRSADEQSARR